MPHAHVTAFAGIQGSVTAHQTHSTDSSQNISHVPLSDGNMLLDPSGQWVIRLRTLAPDTARTLLQVLRDVTPLSTQSDSTLIRRISAYDESASTNTELAAELKDGLSALNQLSHKITRSPYAQLSERPMRRTVLLQMATHPLFERLGVRLPAYSAAAI